MRWASYQVACFNRSARLGQVGLACVGMTAIFILYISQECIMLSHIIRKQRLTKCHFETKFGTDIFVRAQYAKLRPRD